MKDYDYMGAYMILEPQIKTEGFHFKRIGIAKAVVVALITQSNHHKIGKFGEYS